MSRWSQQRRRGGAHLAGQWGGIPAGGWSVTDIDDDSVSVAWTVTLPAGADAVGARFRVAGTAPWGLYVFAAVSPMTRDSLTTATTYEVQTAFTKSGAAVSEWGDIKTVTTA